MMTLQAGMLVTLLEKAQCIYENKTIRAGYCLH